jgi:hypothetical protein
MRVKLGAFVQVTWNDASASASLPFNAERDHQPIVMKTRGWVIAVNSVGISVANETYHEEGQDHFRGWTFSPRGMVTKVTTIR